MPPSPLQTICQSAFQVQEICVFGNASALLLNSYARVAFLASWRLRHWLGSRPPAQFSTGLHPSQQPLKRHTWAALFRHTFSHMASSFQGLIGLGNAVSAPRKRASRDALIRGLRCSRLPRRIVTVHVIILNLFEGSLLHNAPSVETLFLDVIAVVAGSAVWIEYS
jgi:hypothetical protein